MNDQPVTDTTPAITEASATTTETDQPVQPVSPDTQTVQPDTTGSSESESFFDPTTVPDELKPAYKQMQAAFTKKTQALAEKSKETETLRARADAYTRYEKYVPIIDEMIGNPSQPQTSPEMAVLERQLKDQGYSDEAIELAKVMGNGLLNIFTQKQEAQRSQERLNSGIAEAEKLDPRLNDSTLVYQIDENEPATFGEIVARFASTDPRVRQDPVSATKRAIKTVEALIGKAKQDGKEELSASARGKAARFPQVTSSPQSAATANSALSIQEAATLAKQELGIH